MLKSLFLLLLSYTQIKLNVLISAALRFYQDSFSAKREFVAVIKIKILYFNASILKTRILYFFIKRGWRYFSCSERIQTGIYKLRNRHAGEFRLVKQNDKQYYYCYFLYYYYCFYERKDPHYCRSSSFERKVETEKTKIIPVDNR